MCIFTGPVTQVSMTRIFARIDGQMQHIVYEMNLDTAHDVAMVLPIPVEQPEQHDLTKFVDLSDYGSFFADIDQLFPPLNALLSESWGSDIMDAKLEVHSVGAYDASYVPAIEAFSRLDERFRLEPEVWAAFPQYADYGFVVFQLRRGNAKFHPMAFTFQTRDSSNVYFPTTHVHDMKVHATADFDHVLYTQTVDRPSADWITAEKVGAQIPRLSNWWGRDRSKGVVHKESPLHRMQLEGRHENADIWIAS